MYLDCFALSVDHNKESLVVFQHIFFSVNESRTCSNVEGRYKIDSVTLYHRGCKFKDRFFFDTNIQNTIMLTPRVVLSNILQVFHYCKCCLSVSGCGRVVTYWMQKNRRNIGHSILKPVARITKLLRRWRFAERGAPVRRWHCQRRSQWYTIPVAQKLVHFLIIVGGLSRPSVSEALLGLAVYWIEGIWR